MRKSFRLVSLALPVTLVALLSGCLPPDPIITPVPDPTSTPVFESEEEALAAAEAAYVRYLELSDKVAQEGGNDPGRMGAAVTSDWLSKEIEAFASLEASGLRQVGRTEFKTHDLELLDDHGDGTASIVVYICTDSSQTRFVDAAGIDVTNVNRDTSFELEITFDASGVDPSEVLLSGSEPWVGTPFC